MGKNKKNSGGAAMASDVEAGQGIVSEDSFQMDTFWVQVKQIKETNQVIRSKTEQLSKLHAQTLESIQVEEKAALSKQTEQLTDHITQLANQNRALLKTISTDNKKISALVGSTEPTMRMRTNQFTVLSNEFMNALNQSQAAQQAFKDKYRQQLQRQYKVVNPNATEADLNRLVDSEGGSMMADQLFSMDDRRLDAKRALEEMQERHQDIMTIEKSILELHQLFVEMSTLVEQQGELVNQIHEHVEQAVNYTEKAQVEMTKAVKSQKSRIKKMYFLLILLILLSVGGGVAIYFSFFYKKRPISQMLAAEEANASS